MAGNLEQTQQLVRQALAEGMDTQTLINDYLTTGMAEIGQRFQDRKAFVPNLLMSARAMKGALEILKPYMTEETETRLGTIVIGTVKGDLHDIGKNLVASMFEGCGFKVVNLGIDVSSEKFIQAIREHHADIVCLSALLTTTMNYMRNVVADLEKEGLRDRVKVMVGGAPVNEAFCRTDRRGPLHVECQCRRNRSQTVAPHRLTRTPCSTKRSTSTSTASPSTGGSSTGRWDTATRLRIPGFSECSTRYSVPRRRSAGPGSSTASVPEASSHPTGSKWTARSSARERSSPTACRGADRFCLFVATAGREFEDFRRTCKESGDCVREFIADAVGSVLAEACVAQVEQRLDLEAATPHTYPYSPGYCGWRVTEQKLLFGLLPEHPCGIELTESSLMYPIKSVSGVIGIGEAVERKPPVVPFAATPTATSAGFPTHEPT